MDDGISLEELGLRSKSSRPGQFEDVGSQRFQEVQGQSQSGSQELEELLGMTAMMRKELSTLMMRFINLQEQCSVGIGFCFTNIDWGAGTRGCVSGAGQAVRCKGAEDGRAPTAAPAPLHPPPPHPAPPPRTPAPRTPRPAPD